MVANGTAIMPIHLSQLYSQKRWYLCTGSQFNGACPRTDTIVVTEKTCANVVNLGNDKTLCPKDSVVLDAAGNAGAAFEWSNGATSQKVTIKKQWHRWYAHFESYRNQ